MSAHKLTQQGRAWIYERTAWPRFTAECTDFMNGRSRGLSDLVNITTLDNCADAGLWAKAMREAGDYLAKYRAENRH